MDIGLVYSEKDPRQTEARDFVRTFIKERGLLARITEETGDVQSPTLIIDGRALKDRRTQPRDKSTRMYPGISEIAQVLEKHLWCL